MKAEINLNGHLEITPGSTTDLYALRGLVSSDWRLSGVIIINDTEFSPKTEINKMPELVEKEISIDEIPF